MTAAATIISCNKITQTNSIESVSSSAFLKSRVPETAWTGNDDAPLFSSRKISSTELEDEQIETRKLGALSVKRIYPHVFDENITAGQAVIYLRSAIDDENVAIDAFGEPDLQTVNTRLTQIAVTMGKVHAMTDFNESLGAVVSFIRRATLTASNDELSRSALNSLVNVLGLMAANPMMDLDEASDLVDKLSNDGWRGEHKLANELVMALIDSSDLPIDEMQALLFPESQVTEG